MMPKTLIIIRGLPGAGKTTLAELIANLCPGAALCSEDEFWTDANGDYHFDPNTREKAFIALVNNTVNAMHKGVKCIVIHTADLSMNSPDWYVILSTAHICDYQIFPLLLQRNTSNPPSIHNVSEAEMDRLRQSMEHELEIAI